MSISYLPLGNSIDVTTIAITDSVTGSAITDATFTASIIGPVTSSSDGTSLLSGSMSHVGAGVYRARLDLTTASTALVLNSHYYLQASASNYAIKFKKLLRAENRPLVGSGSESISPVGGTSGLPTVDGIPLGDGTGIYTAIPASATQIVLGDGNAASPGTDYAKPATCTLIHKDGTQTSYSASANTDVARWAALVAANAEAIAGDKLIIGPGTYEGTTQVIWNTNLTKIEGAGYKSTVLHSTYTGGGTHCTFVPASNQEFSGIDFEGQSLADGATGATNSQPFGCHGSDTAATNIYVHDCKIGGAIDGLFIATASVCSGVFRNVDFAGNWDTLRVGGNSADAFDFYNCSMTCNGTLNQDKRGAVISSGAIRFFNCVFLQDDSSDSDGSGSHQAIGIQATNAGSVVEVHACKFATSNGSVIYDVKQGSSATLKVDSTTTGSSTNGALLTNGTITPIASAGIALSGTAGSTLNVGTGGTLGTAAYTAASAYEVPLTFSSGVSRSTNTITVDQTFSPSWSGTHTFSGTSGTVFSPISTPGSPTDGAVWYDSTQKCLSASHGGLVANIGRVLLTQYDSVTNSGNTSAATLKSASCIGPLTSGSFPSGTTYFKPGKTIEVEAWGTLKSKASTNVTISIKPLFGTTTLGTITIASPSNVNAVPADLTNVAWRCRWVITCKTNDGTTAAFWSQGLMEVDIPNDTGSGHLVQCQGLAKTATTNVTVSSSKTFDVQNAFSAGADATGDTITMTNCLVRELN